MDARPVVSVLIPASRGAWVAGAVRSALAQTGVELEVIVCNDDPGPEVGRAIGPFGSDPRFRAVRNDPPRGLAGTYRRLVEEARGVWGKFLDDDDELMPGALRALVDAAEGPPPAVLVHALATIENLGDPITPVQRADVAARMDGLELFLRFDRLAPLSPTVLFSLAEARRCDIYDEPGGPSTGDWDAWLRICLGGQVGFLARSVVKHRLHAGSVSSSLTLERRLDAVRFLDAPRALAESRGVLAPRALAAWQRRMLVWQLVGTLSEYLGGDERRTAVRTLRAFWRRRPSAVVAALVRPKVIAALALSSSPRTYRAARGAWRRWRGATS